MNVVKAVVSALHTLFVKSRNAKKWPRSSLMNVVEATLSVIAREKVNVPRHIIKMLTSLKDLCCVRRHSCHVVTGGVRVHMNRMT